MRNNVEIVKLLLQYGANPFDEDANFFAKNKEECKEVLEEYKLEAKAHIAQMSKELGVD